MGDFRITVEGVGSHGCGRGTEGLDNVVVRCGREDCVDCQALRFAAQLKGATIHTAKLEHWPVPGAAGATRTENPGPVDNLREGTREGRFAT